MGTKITICIITIYITAIAGSASELKDDSRTKSERYFKEYYRDLYRTNQVNNNITSEKEVKVEPMPEAILNNLLKDFKISDTNVKCLKSLCDRLLQKTEAYIYSTSRCAGDPEEMSRVLNLAKAIKRRVLKIRRNLPGYVRQISDAASLQALSGGLINTIVHLLNDVSTRSKQPNTCKLPSSQDFVGAAVSFPTDMVYCNIKPKKLV